MPRFTGQRKKSLGRSSPFFEASRKRVRREEGHCWICLGEAAEVEFAPFIWKTLPFDSTAIDLTLKWPDPASFSVDHIIPISALPADSPLLWKRENLRAAHLRCNSARGNGVVNKKDRPVPVTTRNWLA